MSVKLTKGQKISLSKERPGLSKIIVGLGWDAARPQGGGGFMGSLFGGGAVKDIDCDASALLLQNGKFVSKDDVVYFGNLRHKSQSVIHTGDNLTGDGEGDDEQIIINLNAVPQQYDRIVIVVNIYAAYQRKQDFGMISNAFVRVVDCSSNQEVLRYNLSDNYPGMTAMIFGEVYRHNGEWKFNAVGAGTRDGSISEVAKRYT